MRIALTALAVAVTLIGGWAHPASAQTSSEPPDPTPALCVSLTQLTKFTTTGGPFEGGTKITWNVTAPTTSTCSALVITMNGAVVARSGSMVVDPTATSQYGLMAKMGTASKGLASTVALGADIVGYRVGFGRGGAFVVSTMNPTTPSADAARVIAADITGALSTAAELKLVGRTLEVHIIPANGNLTLLPPWRHLKGTMTCKATNDDGTPNPACSEPRLWDTVRGVGSTLIPGTNRIALAVSEESLVDVPSKPIETTLGHTLAHELGHTVLDFAAPHEIANVKKVLDGNGKTHDYMGLDAYTKSTPGEYFAEGTAGLFDYEWAPAYSHEYTPQWLATNEPKLTAILSRVYPGR